MAFRKKFRFPGLEKILLTVVLSLLVELINMCDVGDPVGPDMNIDKKIVVNTTIYPDLGEQYVYLSCAYYASEYFGGGEYVPEISIEGATVMCVINGDTIYAEERKTKTLLPRCYKSFYVLKTGMPEQKGRWELRVYHPDYDPAFCVVYIPAKPELYHYGVPDSFSFGIDSLVFYNSPAEYACAYYPVLEIFSTRSGYFRNLFDPRPSTDTVAVYGAREIKEKLIELFKLHLLEADVSDDLFLMFYTLSINDAIYYDNAKVYDEPIVGFTASHGTFSNVEGGYGAVFAFWPSDTICIPISKKFIQAVIDSL